MQCTQNLIFNVGVSRSYLHIFLWAPDDTNHTIILVHDMYSVITCMSIIISNLYKFDVFEVKANII